MKATLPFLSLGFAMTACVYHEELADVNDRYTAKQETALSYSMPTLVKDAEISSSRSIPSEAFAQVNIRIRNQMPNLHLTVEGIRLCNIHLSGTYHFATEEQTPYWETDTSRSTLAIETGHIALGPNEEMLYPQEGSIDFIPQVAKAWNPVILPQRSEGCYLLLNCKVFNIHDTDQGYQEGKDFMIWGNEKGNSAEAAIPLSIRFKSDEPSVIVLTLAPNCPWYDIRGTSPQALFVPITFDVSVEDWKE